MTRQFNPKLLLVLVAGLMCSLVANAYSFKVDGVFYNIMSSNTVAVAGDTQSSNEWTPGTMPDDLVASYSGYVFVPETVTYNGTTYTVKAVYDCAFIGSSATTIDLPSTITRIGNLAFESSQVRTLKCRASSPPSCDTRYSLSGMSHIETIYVPEESLSDYKYATYWSSYSDYYEALPDYDFTYNNLKFAITSNTTAKVVGFAVTNPSGSWSIPATANGYRVTEVGKRAFINCKNITGMIMGSNITTISTYAFYGCSSLSSVELNPNLTTIGPAAFCYCSSLHAISLPNQLKTIDSRAFSGTGLTSIFIPQSVNNISEDNPFFSCTSMTSIGVNSSNAYYCSEDGILFDKGKTKLFSYPAGKTDIEYTVPSTVTSICPGAFRACKLYILNLPGGLTSIGDYALSYCPNLYQVTCGAIVPPTISNNVFYSTTGNSDLTLTVPKDTKSAYQAAVGWRDFPTINETYYSFKQGNIFYNVTGANTVEVTDESPQHRSYSGSVTIPSTVTYGGVTYTVTAIGDAAFAVCYDLTSVSIPGTVTKVGDLAFYYCTSLTSVEIPNSVTSIGSYAFNTCSALTKVTLPKDLTTLETFVFLECSSLTHVTIPSKVTTIGYGAFKSCTSLTNVTIPSSVTYISGVAFENCTGLKSVTCQAATPPVISVSFSESTYSSATLFVPSASIQDYAETSYWKNFTDIKPTLNYALNTDGGNIVFTSVDDYPWTNVVEDGRVYAVSGNKSMHGTFSLMTAFVNTPQGGTLSFDYKAWGEGSSYDYCTFLIDGSVQFSYGNLDNDWTTFTVELGSASHRLDWIYYKDGSVNAMGDYFAVDNVKLVTPVQPGDINGDGLINVADVTALIQIVLNSTPIDLAIADLTADGNVNVADVTILIQIVLNN